MFLKVRNFALSNIKDIRDMNTYYEDFSKGVEDCKLGVYDKWFRYNHPYDGYAYNLGWCSQNSVTQNEIVRFIECSL